MGDNLIDAIPRLMIPGATRDVRYAVPAYFDRTVGIDSELDGEVAFGFRKPVSSATRRLSIWLPSASKTPKSESIVYRFEPK